MVLPMARDLGFLGIRAVTISPGVIPTPMHEKQMIQLGLTPEQMEPMLEAYTKGMPMGVFGEIDHFAHMVQSSIENPFINACNVRLDGGMRL